MTDRFTVKKKNKVWSRSLNALLFEGKSSKTQKVSIFQKNVSFFKIVR